MGQSDEETATTDSRGNLTSEQRQLLSRAETLEARLLSLDDLLGNLALQASGTLGERIAKIRGSVQGLADQAAKIKEDVRAGGRISSIKSRLRDVSDVAKQLAERTSSVRARVLAPDEELVPEEDQETGATFGGPYTIATLAVGGTLLTAWLALRENQNQESPGETLPAGGALIGQF